MSYGTMMGSARDVFAAHPDIRRAMRAGPTDQQQITYCRALLASRIPEEAVVFCAHMLPHRVAVWWGHECLVNLSSALDEQDFRMLGLVEGWVGDPSEARRADILEEGLSVAQRSPGVWIALAAAWGGGYSPAGLNGRASAASRAARAICTGILAGLARVALDDRGQVLSGFVSMGVHLAEMEGGRRS